MNVAPAEFDACYILTHSLSLIVIFAALTTLQGLLFVEHRTLLCGTRCGYPLLHAIWGTIMAQWVWSDELDHPLGCQVSVLLLWCYAHWPNNTSEFTAEP